MASALTPRLIVPRADDAIAYYQKAFGARLLERFADPGRNDQVVHAAVEICGAVISLADEDVSWGNLGPGALGGSPVLLQLEVADADAVGAAMVEHGAEVVISIDDRFYGRREGRLKDPFGHLWIVSQELEKLSEDEINRKMARR